MIKNELKALKRMDRFKRDYCKLMAKYPEVTVRGDYNGHLVADIWYDSRLGRALIKRGLPSSVKAETVAK